MSILNTNRIISSGQLQDCLAVMIHAASHLRMVSDTPDSGDAPRASASDGGAKMALESTVIKACARLDAILTDDSRWKLPETDAQTLLLVNLAQSVKVQGEQLEQLKMQTLAMAKGISIRFENAEAHNQPPQEGNIHEQ